MRKPLLTLAMLLASATSSASLEDQSAALERARALWKSHAYPSYTYRAKSAGDFGGYKIAVLVRDRKCMSAYHMEQLRKIPHDCDSYTIEGLFMDIEWAIQGQPRKLEVRYDPTRGFPTHISVDGSAVADNDWFFDMEYVRPVK